MVPLLHVGSRVMRGPDWAWQDQDGGPGHVGTLVTIGQLHGDCPAGTVKIIWDTGAAQNYRVGYDGQYDLRLVDHGTSGVSQECECSHCDASPVYGLRWSCLSCPHYSLCSPCYMSGAHDNSHSFTRHLGPGDPGVRVGPRTAERLTELMGIYPGAVVERGPNWRFDNQDGGQGSRGVVRQVHDWEGAGSSTARSVVSVVWSNRVDNMYCRGHKGQVHLRCVTPASGGRVFQAHLPILGFQYETVPTSFVIGQHVMVNVDIETLKQMQVGYGGFNQNMLEVVGKRGKVHRLTEKGLVRVQYAGQPAQDHRWTLNPAALRLVAGHNVGDQVKITSDRVRVGKYVSNPAALESVMGGYGVIKLIHSESSYVIDFGEGKVVTLHPGCIEVTSDDQQTVFASCIKAAVRGDQAAVESFLRGTFSQCDSVNIPDNKTMLKCLHQAASRGHFNVVLVILQYRAAIVNERLEDKTVLQVAAYQGHSMIVDLLLRHGANPGLADKSGDTALHYAAIGARSDAILSLVNRCSEPNYVNCVNNDKRTAAHITVLNRQAETLSTLLKVGASVNIPDCQGDTTLQLAVIQGDHSLLDLVLGGLSGGALLATNSRGHNVLHIACVRGDVAAIEKILGQDRHMINIVSREGESPLHLASQFPPAVTALVRCPQCDLNIADSQGKTVLHWAASRLDSALLQRLVEAGASLDCQDMLGNTPAHLLWSDGLAVTANTASLYSNTMEDLLEPRLTNLVQTITGSQVEQVQLTLLLFLFKHGATNISNYRNDTVTDLIESLEVRRFVLETIKPDGETSDHEYAEIAEEALEREEEPSGPGECRVCNEMVLLVTFLPCQHKVGSLNVVQSSHISHILRLLASTAARK